MQTRHFLPALACAVSLLAPAVHAAPKTPSAQAQLDALTQTIAARRAAALVQLQSAKDAAAAADLKLFPVKASTHFRMDALEKLLATDEEKLAELKASGKLERHPMVAELSAKLQRERTEYDRLFASANAVVTDPAEILVVKAQRDTAVQQVAVAQAVVETLNALTKHQSNLTASIKTK